MAIGVTGLVMCLMGGLAGSETSATALDRPLRVVTIPFAPFVLPQTDPPTGFSVDLWNEIARRMRVQTTWTIVRSPAELVQAVRQREADVAIAAITMTPELDRVVDFSHPYFDSGLQIAVRAQEEGAVLTTLSSIPWLAIGELFAVAIITVFLLANVLWLIERRKNKDFSKSYVRTIGEAVWGTVLIIATLKYDEPKVPAVIKRVAVIAIWLLGVVLIAQLTATVTSSQTVQRLRSSIRGPDDLPGKKIGSVPGTAAADYLTQRGLHFTRVPSGPDGIRMLVQGEVQALVFDAPTLQYWAAGQGRGLVQVVGPLFRPEKYGIVVAEGSALRKPINEALLKLYVDGTYERIRAAWFSTPK